MILTPVRARLAIAALFAFTLAGLLTRESLIPADRDPARTIGDANLGLRIVERLRGGEDYYAAYGDELRRHHYPTKSVLNWRTPMHYRLVSVLSVGHSGTVLACLSLAAVATATLVYARFALLKSIFAPLLLFGAVLPAFLVRPEGVALPEIWGGVLVALSLNAYLARLWLTGAVLGVTAVFMRELSVPYALVCAFAAIRRHRWNELAVWSIGGAGYIAYYVVHAIRVTATIHATDISHAEGWVQWAGIPFVLKTLHTYGWLTLSPDSATPFAAAFGLAGLFAQGNPPQVKWAVLVYVLLFAAVGQPFNYYWGYLTCTVWAHAFVFGSEGFWTLVRVATRGSTAAEHTWAATGPPSTRL